MIEDQESEMFLFWQIALYGGALSHNRAKFRKHDFESKFVDRIIVDSTL